MNELTQRAESIFRLLDRAIWIVTAKCAGRRGGLTATWVSQASLDPLTPQLAVGIGENHFTRELIDGAGALAVHLVRGDQSSLAMHFALGSGRDRDKLGGIAHRHGITGAPLLEDCLAWMECRVFARAAAGERIYYWADVVDGDLAGLDSQPLTERGFFAAATDSQKEQLLAGRNADIALQAPMHQQWRRELAERSNAVDLQPQPGARRGE